MYDPATGLAYDGIEPDGRIDRNSGAESVIPALLGLMEVLRRPVAREYLRYDEIVEVRVGGARPMPHFQGGADASGASPNESHLWLVRGFNPNGRLLSDWSHTVRGPGLLMPVPRCGYVVVEASPN